jgi:hypothetical protein
MDLLVALTFFFARSHQFVRFFFSSVARPRLFPRRRHPRDVAGRQDINKSPCSLMIASTAHWMVGDGDTMEQSCGNSDGGAREKE